MADHKAKTLLNSLVTVLTGLATTGPNVEKTRGYPKSDTPAISVRMAIIDPDKEISNAFLDSHIDIEIIYHVSGSDTDLDDQILDIDAEVYAAIMADRTVAGTVGDAEPQILSFESNAEAEVPTAIGTRRWRFDLRHSITDTTA